MDMDLLFTIIGIVGAVCAVSAYGLLEMGYFHDDSVGFYGLNAIGAALVTAGIAYDFDGGDYGAFGQEACWIIISIAGVIKTMRKRAARLAAAEQAK